VSGTDIIECHDACGMKVLNESEAMRLGWYYLHTIGKWRCPGCKIALQHQAQLEAAPPSLPGRPVTDAPLHPGVALEIRPGVIACRPKGGAYSIEATGLMRTPVGTWVHAARYVSLADPSAPEFYRPLSDFGKFTAPMPGSSAETAMIYRAALVDKLDETIRRWQEFQMLGEGAKHVQFATVELPNDSIRFALRFMRAYRKVLTGKEQP
jgi:hypothetical protein